jgi:hypothetical protein
VHRPPGCRFNQKQSRFSIFADAAPVARRSGLWARGTSELRSARGRCHAANEGGHTMVKAKQIKEHMEVLGSDGKHVGTVDHMEGSDRIKLTRSDPQAAGKHHFIALAAVDHVDGKVHLNKPSQAVFLEWQSAA